MGTGSFRLKKEPDVQSFIDRLAPVPQRQVVRDLEKLASRGLKALPPLTGPVKGPVWELRSKVEGVGLYRLFYYRDGEASFRLFYAYQKKDEKLPDHVRAEVMKRYEQLTGRKL
ncbi:type II toxin-antitoxin system RelE/ParE family toxin [Longimicrobium sp.]|jgi:phage-related protein|uniref:type II toxin-antitoxin system RelE/ParE family toxin n=1 Tax=Longimicrobium sp. TaxID=2029185 RepID=UPI002F94DCC3